MDRYAIIGLGRFGYRLACMLAGAGAEVIGIDRQPAVIEDISDSITIAVAMDSTEEKALISQGVDKVDVAVVGIGADFEATVLTTVILKQLGVPRVVARATTRSRGEILRRVGADALVNPEEESAYRWCHRLLGPNVMEQIPLAEGHSLVQIPVPADWRGKSLAELDVRRRHNVNVVAIRRIGPADTEAPPDSPPPATIEVPLPHSNLHAGDVLVVIGADEAISNLPG